MCGRVFSVISLPGLPVWIGACGLSSTRGWRRADTVRGEALSSSHAGWGLGPFESAFHWGNFMKTLLGMAVAAVPLLATDIASAQNGNMMNGGNWGGGWMGGYGGIWMPILLVIAVVGLVVWIVKRK